MYVDYLSKCIILLYLLTKETAIFYESFVVGVFSPIFFISEYGQQINKAMSCFFQVELLTNSHNSI